jgi:endonuclease/exonuclease/phosphatase family metal-dependent hydrolase
MLKKYYKFQAYLCVLFLAFSTSWAADQIKVLTYNVWGLGLDFSCFGSVDLTCNIQERMPRICELLKKGDWDVVFLQEIWRSKDRALMKDCGYPYSADLDEFGPLNRPDSGVMILSRFPIQQQQRLKYPRNGSIRWIKDGEYASSKSGLFAEIQFRNKRSIWLANTHFVSSYAHEKYEAQRREQFELFVDRAMRLSNGAPLIIGGDFNFSPKGGPTYEPLVDELDRYLPGFFSFVPVGGFQCTSCPDNRWNKDGGAGQIDYLFGSGHFKPITGGIRFRDEREAYYYSASEKGDRALSDHYGWETVFEIRD